MQRRRIAAAALALAALGILIFWLTRGSGGGAAPHAPSLHVALSANPSSLAQTESSVLKAVLSEDGLPLDPKDCWFKFSADGGQVSGHGDIGVFTPTAPGLVRVSVEAGKNGSDAGVKATVEVLIVAAGSDAVASVPDKFDPPAPPPAPMDGPPPVIDEVTVDKTEVCKGEFVTVHVKAHDPRGEAFDPWLNYLVDGNAGQTVPIFYRGGDENNPHYVTVYGKNNRTYATVEVPSVTVKDCKVKRIARVVYSLLANTEADYHFRASVESDPAVAPFVPVSYAWDFGDGTRATTTDGFLDHSYAHRAQDKAYSNFVVKVTMQDAAGEKQLATEALTLANFAFMMRDPDQKHYVALMVEMTPRYPERAADGSVHQTAWVWHNDKKPLHITQVHAVDYTSEGDELRDREVSPEDLFGSDTLAPAGVKIPLSLSAEDADYIQYRTYFIEGEASDGVKAYGAVSLMVPGKIDPKTSPSVDDEVMKQRIVTAMKILGKKPGETISDEDFQRLEEQGLLPHYTPPSPDGDDGVADHPGLFTPAQK